MHDIDIPTLLYYLIGISRKIHSHYNIVYTMYNSRIQNALHELFFKELIKFVLRMWIEDASFTNTIIAIPLYSGHRCSIHIDNLISELLSELKRERHINEITYRYSNELDKLLFLDPYKSHMRYNIIKKYLKQRLDIANIVMCNRGKTITCRNIANYTRIVRNIIEKTAKEYEEKLFALTPTIMEKAIHIAEKIILEFITREDNYRYLNTFSDIVRKESISDELITKLLFFPQMMFELYYKLLILFLTLRGNLRIPDDFIPKEVITIIERDNEEILVVPIPLIGIIHEETFIITFINNILTRLNQYYELMKPVSIALILINNNNSKYIEKYLKRILKENKNIHKAYGV